MSKFNAVLCRAAHEERKRNAELKKLAQKRAEELKSIVSEYVDKPPRDELGIQDGNEEATIPIVDAAGMIGVNIAHLQRIVHSGHAPANVIPSHIKRRTKFMFTPSTVARMVERKQQGFYIGFPELSGEVDPIPEWIELNKLLPLIKTGYAAIQRRCKMGEIEAKKLRLPHGNKWHLSPQAAQSLIDELGI